MRFAGAPLPDDDLAELRALQLRLPYLRRWPWARVMAMPVVLACLRNTLEAQRRARAAMRPGVDNFRLTP